MHASEAAGVFDLVNAGDSMMVGMVIRLRETRACLNV